MSTAKPVQLGLSPEFTNYFEAINLHMQVHKQPHLNTSPSTHQSQTNLSIPVDDAVEEARLVSEMTEQFRLIKQALLTFCENTDSKKIELGQDVEDSFNELWSDNLAVIIKAIDFFKTIFKDVYRYWPYLEGQMDRLVMACVRVIGLMFTRYKSSLFVNSHAATRATIINLLNSTAQLLNSIIRKSPLLPSKISSETYSALFTSLMPYYLISEKESQNHDPMVESKIQSLIPNMLSMSELNNLLLSLLRMINSKLVEYNQDPPRHEEQINILIKWTEQLGSYLSDSKVSNLNLDLILNEADMLIRSYSSSVFESSRDYRLLEAIREIVFKIVEYKGDPDIWDHLMMIDRDQDDSGLIKYINIALERSKVFNVINSYPIVPKPSETPAEDNRQYVLVEKLLKEFTPIIPSGLKSSDKNVKNKEDQDPELLMFHHWLNKLANTSNALQAQLCLDYLNKNFDDLVSKYAKSLESEMDVLIQACTRQYHFFTTFYYPPNVGLASCQSLQMLPSTTSLLKRIFTSTISLSSVTSKTMSHLILHIFSLLSWSSDFSEENITELKYSILTNGSLNKSDLICICLQLLRAAQMYTHKMSYRIFDDIQRCTGQMLTELTLPLQFVPSEMISEQYDLNHILYEINEFLLTIDAKTLQESFDQFLKKENLSERTDDSQLLSVVEQLIHDIVKQRGYSIYDNLKSTPNICAQMQRFIHELIALIAKPNLKSMLNNHASTSTNSTAQRESEVEQRFNCTRAQIPRDVIKQLDEIEDKILPQIRYFKECAFNLVHLAQKLSSMSVDYDSFAQYQTLHIPAIDALTEVCERTMVNLVNRTKSELAENPTAITKVYSKIGELLLKMFGKPESLGNKCLANHRLKALIQANISMLLKHANHPKEKLEKHFHWIWDVQYALTNHSKPYFLLSFSLSEFNSLLRNVLDSDYVSQTKQRNYLLAHLYTSMLEISFDQMFLSSTANYTPQIDRDKFDICVFLRQVDDLFNYYPLSCLEGERDYKILVLIQRVLHRLYGHFGFLIQDLWYDSSPVAISQSHVCAFFEQLIAQKAQIEQKKSEETEGMNAVAITDNNV